jgi:hypothetical protein
MLTSMSDVHSKWSLSNPGPDNLLIWLEPWAEEFEIPPRSTVTFKSPNESDGHALGEVEWTQDYLIIWASAPNVVVLIDDVMQDSCSATIPIPDGLTRELLNIVFADQPAARLGGGGLRAGQRTSYWQRLRRRFMLLRG